MQRETRIGNKLRAAASRLTVPFVAGFGTARVQTKTAEQLRQSSDRGLTWKTLFTTTSVLEQLTLTSNPSLRYYVISNKNTLLRGSFGQQVPDTVLTLERKPIQWPTNIASIHLFISTFDYIYLSAPDIGLYWSTDGGESWGRSEIPWGVHAFFRAVPSKDHRDRLVADAYPWEEIRPTAGGLFTTSNRGASWTVIREDGVDGRLYYLTGEVLFHDQSEQFSTDYGGTWAKNRTGIDTLLPGIPLAYFESQRTFFAGSDSAWFRYTDDTWEEILGLGGERLKGMLTNRAAIDGNRIYVFKPYDGLYTTKSSTLTGFGDNPTSSLYPEAMHIYPNPATTSVTIRRPPFPYDGRASLIVSSTLGKVVRTIPILRAEQVAVWDLRDSGGARVHSGVYYLSVHDGNNYLSKGTVIIY